MAFVNQKGGSGKSKTVIGTAPELARLGRSVLAIDADPQRTLTNAMLTRDFQGPGIAEVLGIGGLTEEQRPKIDDVVVRSEPFGVDVLASNLTRVAMIETELTNDSTRVADLNYAIEAIQRPYDFVLIDTPGNLGPMVMSSIVSAGYIVIVIDSGTEAIEGWAQLQGALGRAARLSEFEVLGVVSTRFKARTNLSKTALEAAQGGSNYRLYATLREATKIGEMNEEHKPMHLLANGRPEHLDFVHLAKQIDALVGAPAKVPA